MSPTLTPTPSRGSLARDFGMGHYTITTRGPVEQTVRSLHFHLVSVD